MSNQLSLNCLLTARRDALLALRNNDMLTTLTWQHVLV